MTQEEIIQLIKENIIQRRGDGDNEGVSKELMEVVKEKLEASEIGQRLAKIERRQLYLEYLILGLHSFMQSSQQLIERWIDIRDELGNIKEIDYFSYGGNKEASI